VDRKTERRMAKMVGVVRPYCRDEIIAALPWDLSLKQPSENTAHSPSVKNSGQTSLSSGPGLLPGRVFIAVGHESIYCFDFAPTLFGFNIKRQVACWPRHGAIVTAERANMMTWLFLTTDLGERHSFETATMTLPKGQLVEAFFAAVNVEKVDRLYLGC
jgi:hypothetical protein